MHRVSGQGEWTEPSSGLSAANLLGVWEIPKIGGYLERFASGPQHIGSVLRG
jgi:hypothetical protein